ncbi:hypothetical protein [Martelella soudanensis]|uniref:hypothetical protein n=1 Tax=unclassified Martelella TaxID=2629616 RepID=UPI0015DE7902|nr:MULTISPECIES: hypothetical protein [unclassified Martelella]
MPRAEHCTGAWRDRNKAGKVSAMPVWQLRIWGREIQHTGHKQIERRRNSFKEIVEAPIFRA